MMRIVFTGSELAGFAVGEPAASVRLLIPAPRTDELVMPTWNGNEFLLPDGTRPAIRTFTPRHFDGEALELQLDMVIHEGGVASAWAKAAVPGRPAALSGPGRGYTIDPSAPQFLLAGDETAIPAMAQLLEQIPSPVPVRVHIEIAHSDARLELPEHPLALVEWHQLPAGAAPGDALVAAVRHVDINAGCRIWCAGEAAAMHRIRTYLFKERELPRSQATVRGYWKSDRRDDGDAS
jgi:NADPH-dependent ferric siderophore reductase